MKRVFFISIIAAILLGGNFFSIAAQESDESLMQAFRQAHLDDGQKNETPAPRFIQQSKLTANDGAADDNFGVSIAIAGDTAVIGTPRDDIGANTDQGSAYVFVRVAGVWTFQQKLTASDGAANDSFASSVAIADASAPSQTVIMIGAFGDDIGANINQGSVYVFVRNSAGGNFSQQGKITASDGATDDVFGASVAMTGSFVIIGANGVDIGANVSQGAAYIFVRSGTTWLEEQKLVQTANNGAATRANFGWSVGISGTTAIVGTNYLDTTDGRISIYERVTSGNTWNLTAFSGTENAVKKFGFRVGIFGDTVIVGCPEADLGLNLDQGEARVLFRSGGSWAYGPTLAAPDGAANDYFGVGVAVSGNTIVVGAYNQTVNGNFGRGSAYLFSGAGNSWAFRQKLIDSDGSIEDYFGFSVAISSGTIIVSALQDDVGALAQAGSASIFLINTPFDFDGDGKTDIGIFRPTGGEWWIQRSLNSQTFALQFGSSSNKLTPADFTGDGKTDVAFFRPSNGQWFVLRSEDSTFYAFPFGTNGDTPVPSDFDGDGKADAAVFRSSNLTWFILKSSGGTDIIGFGAAGDKPVVADYDGDAKADIAIFRANGANGEWWIRRSSNLTVFATVFGTPTDKPTQGDFTGDGKADIAFFRQSNGNWFILRSEDFSFYSFPFGAANDVPVAGDYDGDGKFDAGIFRPSNSTWFINRSTAGTLIQQFGISGDVPLPNAFVP